MGLYIRFVEQDNPQLWRSPILYIHNDEEEFRKFLERYLKELYEWQKVHSKQWGGLPLGRLEAQTVICDFMYRLTNYYQKTYPPVSGRIVSWMRLVADNFTNENIEEIFLQKPK